MRDNIAGRSRLHQVVNCGEILAEKPHALALFWSRALCRSAA
jgi:hypothetical protein